jgi:hypothetical protein
MIYKSFKNLLVFKLKFIMYINNIQISKLIQKVICMVKVIHI